MTTLPPMILVCTYTFLPALHFYIQICVLCYGSRRVGTQIQNLESYGVDNFHDPAWDRDCECLSKALFLSRLSMHAC